LSSQTPKQSYHNLPPLESGGEINRIGIHFQDHVAASYCIEMLRNNDLAEVWCESLDDVTLIYKHDTQEEFVFVQVKSNEFKHLWSVAELCKCDGKGKASILEKSLDYDRGSENCSFRIVTSHPVNDELKILTLPFTSPERSTTSSKLDDLCKLIEGKRSDYKSPNDNGAKFWLAQTIWEVRYSIEAVRNENLLNLKTFAESIGIYLVTDQLEELYKKIIHKVEDAGRAKWKLSPANKKIKKENFTGWIKNLISSASNPSSGGIGEQLKQKMGVAGIADNVIEMAQEQRRAYKKLLLNPVYLDLSEREKLEMEIQANLNQLLSQLDTGQLEDSGVEFHSRCLETLSRAHSEFQGKPPLSLLQGYMYNLADRCVYRFTRAT
jgi:Cap4 dsDNA endonuclease